MACDACISVKVLLFLLSMICIIVKRITDYDAERLYYLLENLSYEWPLLSNISWNKHGDSFLDITFGGYVIICFGLLIGAASGDFDKRNAMEIYFLLMGGILYGAAAALILASIDQVPHHLVDHAAGLGAIVLLTALLFFLDLALTGKRNKKYKRKLMKRQQQNMMHQYPPAIIKSDNFTQTIDQPKPPPSTFMGPLYPTKTDGPFIHRFRNPNQTIPKWVGSDDTIAPEMNQNIDEEIISHHPPPPAGFIHDTPSRGYVLKTAKKWPKVADDNTDIEDEIIGKYRKSKINNAYQQDNNTPSVKTKITKTRSSETLDIEDINSTTIYEPHSVEIVTETPRTVINTKVLHRWLNQKRDTNGTNKIA